MANEADHGRGLRIRSILVGRCTRCGRAIEFSARAANLRDSRTPAIANEHEVQAMTVTQSEIGNLVDGLRKITTRTHAGTVMVGAAIIDDGLRGALLSRMPRLSRKMKDRIFDGYGPLNSLSAKCDLAFALGLIDAATYEKISVLKKVRNTFAHSGMLLTFESEEIASVLGNSKTPGKHADNQTQFMSLLRDISGQLSDDKIADENPRRAS